MFFYKLRKARAEAKKAKVEAEAARLALETRALGQIIVIYANAVKAREGTHDVEFSEEELRNALRNDAPRLHAVLDLLTLEGKATKADRPGYWIIK